MICSSVKPTSSNATVVSASQGKAPTSLTIASPASMTLGSDGLRHRAVMPAISSVTSVVWSRSMMMSCAIRRSEAPYTRFAAEQSMTRSFSAACIASALDGLS